MTNIDESPSPAANAMPVPVKIDDDPRRELGLPAPSSSSARFYPLPWITQIAVGRFTRKTRDS